MASPCSTFDDVALMKTLEDKEEVNDTEDGKEVTSVANWTAPGEIERKKEESVRKKEEVQSLKSWKMMPSNLEEGTKEKETGGNLLKKGESEEDKEQEDMQVPIMSGEEVARRNLVLQ